MSRRRIAVSSQKAPSTRRPIDRTYSPSSSPLRAGRPGSSAWETLLTLSPEPGFSTTTPGCARSHRRERRPFGLTSSEAGGWRCPRGRRWRLASGHRKVVKLGLCWPVPQGACGAGGTPAPGNGARTLPQRQGVRKHPAPEGALRLSLRACNVYEQRSESTQHQKAY